EAERVLVVVLRIDLRQLAITALPKLLLDVVVPADRLENADLLLRLDDAPREPRDELLVASPRPSRGERRDRRMARLIGVGGRRCRTRGARRRNARASALLRRRLGLGLRRRQRTARPIANDTVRSALLGRRCFLGKSFPGGRRFFGKSFLRRSG